MANALRMRAPSSKSQTQRALILAALSDGECELLDPLDCSDSRGLRAGLRALGVEIDDSTPSRWRIRGGRLQPPDALVDCLDGGTTVRFLAALSLLVDGPLALDGSARLRERPLAPLVRALAELGVESDGDTLPLTLQRDGPPEWHVEIDASQSSQFASALMMVAPLLPEGLELALVPSPLEGAVSLPYLAMTAQMMRQHGARVHETPDGFQIRPRAYRAQSIAIEGDWSAAAFLLVAGLLSGKEIDVVNVSSRSEQGDRAIVEMLSELRMNRAHHFDLTSCPDLLPPLAVACCSVKPPCFIDGVAHARVKESDRVNAMAEGLQAVGVDAQERDNGLLLQHCDTLRPARIDPRGDHRIAMAFGLLSLLEPGIEVEDRRCVDKSFPDFWEQLERFR